MLPLIIVGGVAAVVMVGSWVGIGVSLRKDFLRREEDRKEFLKKVLFVENNPVEIISKNYKGEIKAVSKSTVDTLFCEDKETAEIMAKYEAAMKGANVIWNVEYIPEQCSDGNYKFKRWSIRGVAGKRT